MNKEELLKEIEETKKHLEELERMVNEESNYGWQPDEGEKYFAIDNDGVSEYFNFTQWRTDILLSIGNVFRTREEAEFEYERRKVIHELRLLSRNFTSEELKDDDLCKYFIMYDIYNNRLEPEYYDAVIETNILFDSYSQVQEAIKKVGEDRIKKYYFGIED